MSGAMHFAAVGGLTLHYALDGPPDGLPLFFVNSLGTDLRLWEAVLPSFAGQYRLIRYDFRGHGLSDCPPPPYTITDHAADLHGLLNTLQVESAILVGISVGGQIALAYAAAHPERIRSLVLCDTGTKIGSAAMWNERIERLRQEGMDSLADSILARWFTPSFAQANPAVTRGYTHMLTRTPLAGYIGTCAALRDADLADAAQTVKARALVICGAEDVATPPDLGRALANTLPDARFSLIDGAAHLPCVEQSAAFAALLHRFLEELEHV